MPVVSVFFFYLWPLHAFLPVYKYKCWQVSANLYAWLHAHLYKCACVCLHQRAQTWFNAKWHPQHQWRSIYLLFGKGLLQSRAVPSTHDIYEAPMSPGTCCPDNWDSFGAMTTKRQTLSQPNLCGPLPTQRWKALKLVGNLNKILLQLIKRENTWHGTIRREDRSETWGGDWVLQKQTERESRFPCKSILMSWFVRQC